MSNIPVLAATLKEGPCWIYFVLKTVDLPY